MKRRAAALILGLMMLFQLSLPRAEAAASVYFVAAGIDVQPLDDAVMPFWSNGYLYVASSLFTGTVRNNLKVRNDYTSSNMVILTSGVQQRLVFDLEKGYGQDLEGNAYTPGAIWKNGVAYVPASVVAKVFGLLYSITDVENGYLVWLRRAGTTSLTDKQFADAAAYPMAARYAEYLKGKEPPSPENQDLDIPGETAPPAEGKSVYLCFRAGEDTAALLDVLDRAGAKGAFFCDSAFLAGQGDLLRRMTATGHAVGLLADGTDPDRSLLQQLEEGNQALARATCGKTRLVYVESGGEKDLAELKSLGFACLEPDLDRTGYDLQSAGGANSLLQRVSARRGDVTVWLGDTAGTAGLRAFLSAAARAEDHLPALTELS